MYSNTDEYYKNCETLSLILQELTAAKAGIEHLKFTYSADPNVNSQLDILVIKINSSIRDMQHKTSYFESFLPESYKQEVNPQTINPNYYMNEITPIHSSSSSNAPHQQPDSYTEQFMEINTDELNYISNVGMTDELNSTMVDMNNTDSR
jgi:hypothetical protein